MKTIKVSDFTKYPSGRYEKDGPNSGEEFRVKFLANEISAERDICVDLDGTLGYGSSFLEEAFGGLLRPPHNFEYSDVINHLNFSGPQEYIDEAMQYIEDQSKR